MASIPSYAAPLLLAPIPIVMGMAWYKITSRRNRTFEPTLWWLFRWAYLFEVSVGYGAVLASRFELWARAHSLSALLLVTVFLLSFVSAATADWRATRRRELDAHSST